MLMCGEQKGGRMGRNQETDCATVASIQRKHAHSWSWFPGKERASILILERIPACVHAKSLQSCLTLRDPIDCSPPGSSVRGMLQARILEWVAISFSRKVQRQKFCMWVLQWVNILIKIISWFLTKCTSLKDLFNGTRTLKLCKSSNFQIPVGDDEIKFTFYGKTET